jgi:hypothetical protein
VLAPHTTSNSGIVIYKARAGVLENVQPAEMATTSSSLNPVPPLMVTKLPQQCRCLVMIGWASHP